MAFILLAAVIGVAIGIIVGALGAGGGILAVPVLVYLLGFEPHNATAASLIVVIVTAIVAIRHPLAHGNVAWREGLVFGSFAILGAATGSRTSLLIDEQLLMLLFGALLFSVSLLMFRRAARTRAEENATPAHPPSLGDTPGDAKPTAPLGEAHTPAPSPTPRRTLSVLIVAALATGVLTGFFGVGGGFLAVPMLMIAVGLPMRRAAGTSLIVMTMSALAALTARIGTDTQIDVLAVSLFAFGSSIGGALGGPLSANARASTLTFCFASLLAVFGAFTLITTLLT